MKGPCSSCVLLNIVQVPNQVDCNVFVFNVICVACLEVKGGGNDSSLMGTVCECACLVVHLCLSLIIWLSDLIRLNLCAFFSGSLYSGLLCPQDLIFFFSLISMTCKIKVQTLHWFLPFVNTIFVMLLQIYIRDGMENIGSNYHKN